jgi:hypothetical protein
MTQSLISLMIMVLLSHGPSECFKNSRSSCDPGFPLRLHRVASQVSSDENRAPMPTQRLSSISAGIKNSWLLSTFHNNGFSALPLSGDSAGLDRLPSPAQANSSTAILSTTIMAIVASAKSRYRLSKFGRTFERLAGNEPTQLASELID